MYAIVETGGKQYKVTPGQRIDVEKLEVMPGNAVDLERVLLIADGEKVITGTPTVSGARVVATVERQDKSKKIVIMRYKSKVRHRNKTGHRQPYTRLVIDKIVEPGAAATETTEKATHEVGSDGTQEGGGEHP